MYLFRWMLVNAGKKVATATTTTMERKKNDDNDGDNDNEDGSAFGIDYHSNKESTHQWIWRMMCSIQLGAPHNSSEKTFRSFQHDCHRVHIRIHCKCAKERLCTLQSQNLKVKLYTIYCVQLWLHSRHGGKSKNWSLYKAILLKFSLGNFPRERCVCVCDFNFHKCVLQRNCHCINLVSKCAEIVVILIPFI